MINSEGKRSSYCPQVIIVDKGRDGLVMQKTEWYHIGFMSQLSTWGKGKSSRICFAFAYH